MPALEVLARTDHIDQRGTISTFLPPEAIVEYNIVTIRAGEVRGLHWHPHFIEYLAFVSGLGVLRWRDKDGGAVHEQPITPGLSTRAASGVAHSVEAFTDLAFVALLTRRWADCDPPIVRCEV